MALQGPIKELGLFELFQLLSFTQKTGRLELKTDSRVIRILFRNGNDAYVFIPERIKEHLVRTGRLTPDVASSLYEDNLEKELVERGILTVQELRSIVASLGEKAIYELFKIEDGFFTFYEEEISPPWDIDLGFKTENLIMEAARRVDELEKMKTMIPSYDVVFSLSPEVEKKKFIRLTPKEWMLLSYIDGKRTVREIVSLMGEEFETVKILYGLLMAGLITEKKEEGVEEKVEREGKERLKELFRERKFREGLEEIERMKKEHPTDPEIPYEAGFFHLKLGNFKEAIAEWGEFLTLAPGDRRAQFIRELIDKVRSIDEAILRKDEL